MKIVVVSGGFDPIHSGHIAHFKAAKELGDKLVVGINSDAWLTRKKGRPFMPYSERMSVIQNLKMVDFVIEFNDDDGSASNLLRIAKQTWPNDEIIFANGGDRREGNIPEMVVDGIKFVFGVGGDDKKNSSSWLLDEWKAPKTERQWGYYRVLHDVPGLKVKELTVNPGSSLSMQRHAKRNEYWIVAEGECNVASLWGDMEMPTQNMEVHESTTILQGHWHRLENPFDKPCRIVEIQYGQLCDEEDIERK